MFRLEQRGRHLLSGVFIAAAAVIVCAAAASPARAQSCLPPDIKPTEIVSTEAGKDGRVIRNVTVKDRLVELKARCRKGKLTDARGKQIYFYRLIGCWGNPPADYQEQFEAQRVKLRQLQKRYTVIQIPCLLDRSIS